MQVCLKRAQELLLGMEALVPIVKALQCAHLQPSHWERLQGLVGGLPVGPESEVTLLQLTGVHVCAATLASGKDPRCLVHEYQAALQADRGDSWPGIQHMGLSLFC